MTQHPEPVIERWAAFASDPDGAIPPAS